MHDDRRNAPRFRTSTPVTGRQPATPFKATIENVSRTGCKMKVHGANVPLGSTVLLQLPGHTSTSGQVVWDRMGYIGVEFHRAIPDAVVGDIAGLDLTQSEGEWLLA